MMRTLLRRTTLAAAVAAVVVTTAAPAGAASDVKIAKQGTIVASDVPSPWKSEPNDDSGDKRLDKIAAKVPDCKDFIAVDKIDKVTPNAESRIFTDGQNRLSNEAQVFASIAKAEAALKLMSSSTIASCMNTVFKKAFEATLPKKVKDVQVGIEQSTDLSALDVDGGVAYGGTVQAADKNGRTTVFAVAVVAVRVGQSILTYSIFGVPGATGQLDSSFTFSTTGAINATVARMKDALASEPRLSVS